VAPSALTDAVSSDVGQLFVAAKEGTGQGVCLRPGSPRLLVKQSVAARTPEARFNKLKELAQAVAGEGEVSWTQFDRSKSIHRFGLPPEKLSSLKAIFQVQAGSLQEEVVSLADKEQVVVQADSLQEDRWLA
jgi:hypothetical protein